MVGVSVTVICVLFSYNLELSGTLR